MYEKLYFKIEVINNTACITIVLANKFNIKKYLISINKTIGTAMVLIPNEVLCITVRNI